MHDVLNYYTFCVYRFHYETFFLTVNKVLENLVGTGREKRWLSWHSTWLSPELSRFESTRLQKLKLGEKRHNRNVT